MLHTSTSVQHPVQFEDIAITFIAGELVSCALIYVSLGLVVILSCD